MANVDSAAPRTPKSLIQQPASRRGRRFPTHTPLGRIMAQRGLRHYVVCGEAIIPTRTLTEYLAGNKPIKADHLARLSHYLRVPPNELQYIPPDD